MRSKKKIVIHKKDRDKGLEVILRYFTNPSPGFIGTKMIFPLKSTYYSRIGATIELEDFRKIIKFERM